MAALAALVSETPGTISGEQLAVNFKFKLFRDQMVLIFTIEMAIHSNFVVQLQVFVYKFTGGKFASNNAFVYLFDSVRSKIN